MFGFFNSPKSSTKLNPVPLRGFSPSLLFEGCGTGRAYIAYLAQHLELGLLTFNHCASLSYEIEPDPKLAVGYVHDLHHSQEWRKLSPGRTLNLGLSAPTALGWSDLHHFKIPTGWITVNVFATDFTNSKLDEKSHTDALSKCVEDLKDYHARLDKAYSLYADLLDHGRVSDT